MKLLILTSYFPPDLSAGSFRMKGLVDALARNRAEGLEVDLITTLPNRYATLRAEAPPYEDHGWLRIHRILLPLHKNGMIDQARSYLSYASGVKRITKNHSWDLVFATSSRLMTAALGAHIAKRARAPLYLDIRDIFTDNMKELWADSPLRALVPIFELIERRSFRSAKHINVVSSGFLPHIKQITSLEDVKVFTNGIDDIFLKESFKGAEPQPNHIPIIVYAGNMGEGQGLHHILPEVAKHLEGKVNFRLIGDGGRRGQLVAALQQLNVTNVDILDPVPRSELLTHYREADILFLHLNDLLSFRKVLPSKIFEYAAIGKPILAGVAGYAAEFLRKEVEDAQVFDPCDADGMIRSLQRILERKDAPNRMEFIRRFSRDYIMDNMASDILSTARNSKA